MYSKYAHVVRGQGIFPVHEVSEHCSLRPHHHIRIDGEFRLDCTIWLEFLAGSMMGRVCRPMLDLDSRLHATEIGFATDASANCSLGFGCVFGNNWTFGMWEQGFIKKHSPSIEYLELYALVVGVFTFRISTAQYQFYSFV